MLYIGFAQRLLLPESSRCSARACSHILASWLSKFIGRAEGSTVGVRWLGMPSGTCGVRLPIENMHRAA